MNSHHLFSIPTFLMLTNIVIIDGYGDGVHSRSIPSSEYENVLGDTAFDFIDFQGKGSINTRFESGKYHKQTLVIKQDLSVGLTVPSGIGLYRYLFTSSNDKNQVTVKCSFQSVSASVTFQGEHVADFTASSPYSEIPITHRWTSYSSNTGDLQINRKHKGGKIECLSTTIPKNKCGCGIPDKFTYHSSKKNPSKSTRIVGGKELTGNVYPWQAGLIYIGRYRFVHFCGASVIASRWVLTAAHCVHPLPFKNQKLFRVLLGVHDLQKISVGNLFPVRRILAHPQYDQFTVKNDIALLEMKSSLYGEDSGVKMGSIKPICLPPMKGGVSSDVAAKVAGWGLTSDKHGAKQSTILKETTVYTLSTDRCKSLYQGRRTGLEREFDINSNLSDFTSIDIQNKEKKKFGEKKGVMAFMYMFLIKNSTNVIKFKKPNTRNIMKTPHLSDTTICANNFHSTSDACSGDSGGPLFKDSLAGNVVQVGIVSWGKECGDPKRAGVYTDVSKYINWIISKTGMETKCNTAS